MEQKPEETKTSTVEVSQEAEISRTRSARNKVAETVQKVTKQTLAVSFGTFLLGMLVMFGILNVGTGHHGHEFSSTQYGQEQVGRSTQNNSSTGGYKGNQNNQNRSNQNGDQNHTQNGQGSSDTISGASEHT